MDEICELEFVRYSQTSEGQDYFYINEQSSLQVLRELPLSTPINVTGIFSHRHRIAKQVDAIKASKNIANLLEIVLPLVENGNFPCDDFTVILNNEIELQSHDDGEVHLSSFNKASLHDLLAKVFARQGFNPKILFEVISQPNLYHRLERPDKIVGTYKTFDEVIDAI